MKCIIIGAGNAGRPAARILNHAGNEVIINDRKILEEFPAGVQKTPQNNGKRRYRTYDGF